MTELQTLKKKKKEGKANAEDLTRLKLLQDGEPLSASDFEKAKEREEDRAVADKKEYDERKEASAKLSVSSGGESTGTPVGYVKEGTVIASQEPSLDQPPEHPRIAQIKEALLPFTQIEAHDSRANEFVLFTRGIAITAGDVRRARKAMKL